MPSELRHGVIGLPQSGKTTFLAALWHLVTADEVEVGLACRSMQSDVGYLDEIAENWRSCRPMERTRSLTAEYVTLELTESATALEFDLHFPDVAGESFHEQLMTRQLEERHASWLQHPGGTLLFLSAEARPDGQRLADLEGLLESDDGDLLDQDSGAEVRGTEKDQEEPATETEARWTAKMMTEQAKLVELLQIARHLDEQDDRPRVAIIISAWDMIVGEFLTPDDWLRRERPLLWQYVTANQDEIDARIFGVSAQGGRVEDATKKAELLAIISPSNRILCVDAETTDHDLTRPIRWLNRTSSRG